MNFSLPFFRWILDERRDDERRFRAFFLGKIVVATRWESLRNVLGHLAQRVGTPFPTCWCNKMVGEKVCGARILASARS